MFRPHWVCPAHGCLCFPVYPAQAPGCSIWSGPCVECGSSFPVLHKSADSVAPAFCAFPGLSGSGSQGLGRPLPGCGVPFPSAASARAGRVPAACVCFQELASSRDPPGGDVDHPESQEVFRQDPGPLCRVGGGGFSGAEFAPFLSPASYLQRGWAALLWSFSVPLFCEPPAVGSGG